MSSFEEKILSLLMEMKEEFNTRFESIEEKLSNLKGQTAENTCILKAVEHRGEVTSAELQGFKLEMSKELGASRAELKKELSAFKEETRENFKNTASKEDLKEVKEALNDIPTIKKILMSHEWILQNEGFK